VRLDDACRPPVRAGTKRVAAAELDEVREAYEAFGDFAIRHRFRPGRTVYDAHVEDLGRHAALPAARGFSRSAARARVGNYNRRSPWGIPKGLPDEGESLEAAARRETEEETGVRAGELFALGDITYTKSRKRIHCFGGRAPADCEPRCASWEIDGAEFVAIDEARRRIHPDQAPFLDRLIERDRSRGPT
jgi:8-oxo-dGTP pyrophosphatase MutT (NUDIX family)